jgi:hypothetical protein
VKFDIELEENDDERRPLGEPVDSSLRIVASVPDAEAGSTLLVTVALVSSLRVAGDIFQMHGRDRVGKPGLRPRFCFTAHAIARRRIDALSGRCRTPKVRLNGSTLRGSRG